MNYKDTITWMFSMLPMYQQQGATAYKKDISRAVLLASHLNHPEQQFKSIHVGGTNGKGSTSHMLAAILQDAGYKVGLYTSPHLKDFRERIKINGQMIPKDQVVSFIEEHKIFLSQNQLSFFEMTVGLAFDYFAKQSVDFAVIEVGMGGRLDSTNIITPEVSVITNIGLDHTQFLGNTLRAIATEKAGIIKTKVPVVIGETQDDTTEVFVQKAKAEDSEIYFADQAIKTDYSCSLLGDYQKKNIKTVIKTLQVLSSNGINILDRNISHGLSHVQDLTGLRGRWDVIWNYPKIICDTAHNEQGLSLVLNQLQREKFKNLHMVLGFVKDKSLNDLVRLFPKQAKYYFCKPQIQRGLETKILRDLFNNEGYQGQEYPSVEEAVLTARQIAENEDLIFVGGSTFVVAEVL